MKLTTAYLLQHENDPETRSQIPLPSTINGALPPELLLSVFDFIYTEMTQPLSYPHTRSEVVAMHSRHALLDVMLVCRAWRNLVVASTRYWTTINVGIREALGHGSSPGGTSIPGHADYQKEDTERQLERSGERSIQVNVGMDKIEDVEVVFGLLRNQAHRWQVFNLLTAETRMSEEIGQSEFMSLFNLPLPRLTSLHVGRCWVRMDASERFEGICFQVDAPNLHALSCEVHLALPHSPSRLKFLSLRSVYLGELRPPVGELRVKLEQLSELRITDCNLGAILSAFSTPFLSKLVVDDPVGHDPVPDLSLPQYHHLKELQWRDVGWDQALTNLLPLCPNLVVFANYIVGLEADISPDPVYDTATILLEVPKIRDQLREGERLWPSMTEILLDSATSTEIAELVDAVPSIQRVRVLQDPTTCRLSMDQERECVLLERVRERVNVALRLEPWSDSKILKPGEVAVGSF